MAEFTSVTSLGSCAAAEASTGAATTHLETHGSSLVISGTFVGTVKAETTADGTTWIIAKDNTGTLISTTAPATFTLSGAHSRLRIECTAYTSGTIDGALIARRVA